MQAKGQKLNINNKFKIDLKKYKKVNIGLFQIKIAISKIK